MSSQFAFRHLHNQYFNTIKFISVMLLLSLLLTSPGVTSPAYASGRCYVKSDASGLNNGTTWKNAYTDLQSALPNLSCTEVWVAAGTYYPTSSSDQTISFVLRETSVSIPAIAVYGGFAGTESVRSQRKPSTHVTILSGDIGIRGFSRDNSLHVVTGGGTFTSDVLDGFTITAGNATGSSYPNYTGGGMLTTDKPMLQNLIFNGNAADAGGGGLSSYYGKPTLTNVAFIDNLGNTGGGMINVESSPMLTNVTFSGNASYNGGAMFNLSLSDPILKMVTFSNNLATTGAGISNTESNPKLTDITFTGNIADSAGGGIYNDTSNPTLTNVTFSDNSATKFGGGMFNLFSNPTLTNVTFRGNSAEPGDGGGSLHDLASAPHIYDSIFWNNGTEIDGGTSSFIFADNLIAGGCPSGVTCTGTLLTSDPMLGPLANNGGFTKTMALKAGSPAIDAGNNATCASTDQRGIHRPQGAHCDIGAYEARYMTFRSNGSQDGWVLESGENTNVGGGSPDSTGSTLTLGDNTSRKQYRSVMSFSTASIPDHAVISSISLKLKRSSVTPPATNPISLLQGIMLDMKKGFFGSSSALQTSDFQASATKTVGPYSPALSSGFYSINLPATTFTSINKLNTNGGLTQIRLRFKLDDNNNSIANTLNLISGNNLTPSNRPELIIVFYTP